MWKTEAVSYHYPTGGYLPKRLPSFINMLSPLSKHTTTPTILHPTDIQVNHSLGALDLGKCYNTVYIFISLQGAGSYVCLCVHFKHLLI